MNTYFEISDKVKNAAEAALKKTEAQFAYIERLGEFNQQKVLAAFIKNKVDETDFNSTTGYGYGDTGREKADRLTADIFGCEDAIIRAGALACGTHTLGVALYGVLRPGDTMLCVSGAPYDTLHPVIGLDSKSKGQGTLIDFGVRYEQIDLTENDEFDYEAIEEAAADKTVRMVYIQRSRGYLLRHSITIALLFTL